MMLTVQQASETWCPMVRAANGTQATNCAVNTPEVTPEKELGLREDHQCISTSCAMWRWGPTTKDTNLNRQRGFCGLAGVPLEAAR